jgi:hypothetical protein
MEATRLEATLEETEAAMERQELFKEIYAKTSGHRRTDLDMDAWLCDVGEGRRSRSKTVLGPSRNSLPPAS